MINFSLCLLPFHSNKLASLSNPYRYPNSWYIYLFTFRASLCQRSNYAHSLTYWGYWPGHAYLSPEYLHSIHPYIWRESKRCISFCYARPFLHFHSLLIICFIPDEVGWKWRLYVWCITFQKRRDEEYMKKRKLQNDDGMETRW